MMPSPSPDPKILLGLYDAMLTIRLAEERLQRLFTAGEVPGFIPLSIGQEAVPLGVAAALRAVRRTLAVMTDRKAETRVGP